MEEELLFSGYIIIIIICQAEYQKLSLWVWFAVTSTPNFSSVLEKLTAAILCSVDLLWKPSWVGLTAKVNLLRVLNNERTLSESYSKICAAHHLKAMSGFWEIIQEITKDGQIYNITLDARRSKNSLVAPGSGPLHLTPRVPDPDQLHHVSAILHLPHTKVSNTHNI